MNRSYVTSKQIIAISSSSYQRIHAICLCATIALHESDTKSSILLFEDNYDTDTRMYADSFAITSTIILYAI